MCSFLFTGRAIQNSLKGVLCLPVSHTWPQSRADHSCNLEGTLKPKLPLSWIGLKQKARNLTLSTTPENDQIKGRKDNSHPPSQPSLKSHTATEGLLMDYFLYSTVRLECSRASWGKKISSRLRTLICEA